jgi:hypothetical protein
VNTNVNGFPFFGAGSTFGPSTGVMTQAFLNSQGFATGTDMNLQGFGTPVSMPIQTGTTLGPMQTTLGPVQLNTTVPFAQPVVSSVREVFQNGTATVVSEPMVVNYNWPSTRSGSRSRAAQHKCARVIVDKHGHKHRVACKSKRK